MARRRQRYVFASRPVRRGRRFFLRLLFGFALLIALCAAVNIPMQHQAEVVTQRVTVSTLPADLENWSILLISDLHGREIGGGQSGLKTALGSLRYSCVVLCGDMTGPGGDVSAALELMELIPDGTPVLFVPGDEDPALLASAAHGSLSVYSDWAQALIEAGATPVDGPVPVTRGKHTLWFAPEYAYTLDVSSMQTAYMRTLEKLGGDGVILTPDEAAQKRAAEYGLERLETIRTARKTLTENDVLITLSHVPLTSSYMNTVTGWSDAESSAFSLRESDLILSGHWCAGQWRVPFSGALWSPEGGWFPGDEGLTGVQWLYGVPQVITPGLSASAAYPYPAFRLFNRPAVTLVYLTARLI